MTSKEKEQALTVSGILYDRLREWGIEWELIPSIKRPEMDSYSIKKDNRC